MIKLIIQDSQCQGKLLEIVFIKMVIESIGEQYNFERNKLRASGDKDEKFNYFDIYKIYIFIN